MTASLLLTFISMLTPADSSIDFARDVRPILAEYCFECHGPDEARREAELRLDIQEEAFSDRGGYFAVVPEDVHASELIQRIFDASDPMPPAEIDRRPSARDLGVLRRWVEEGAVWGDHWAYVPPVSPPIPDVAHPDWLRNGVDSFVLARLESEGLRPSEEAERAALLRRVTLDLTGLPPTVEELDVYLADESPGAYERVVDRLLDSPRYGESMAREWLDAARYGDTHGLHLDNERTIWPYRDWVVRAFNENKPFDEFTVEQLAGDLLEDPTRDQIIATGFNRCNPTTAEGGLIDAEYLVKYAVDRVETTSTVWMATTMGCAVCHDHKYDPFTQKEFYELFAFFNSIDENASDGNARDPKPVIRVPSKDQEAAIAQAKAKVGELTLRRDGPMPEMDAAQAVWEKSELAVLHERWSVPEVLSASSRNGAVLTTQEGGSILASGENPATDTYEITLRGGEGPVRALRLEGLRHESFQKGGVGRADNANLVLTDVKVEVSTPDQPDDFLPVKLVAARADFSQAKFEVTKAIDDDPKSGWAIDARPEDRVVIFVPAEPVDVGGKALLRVTLAHDSQFARHQLGHFRISTTGDPNVAITSRGNWWSLGPFASGERATIHAAEHGPETGVNLDEKVGEVAWVEHPEYADGAVHSLLPGDFGSTYLFREVFAPSARTISISLGSDDSLIVWLNGQEILNRDVARGVAPDQDLIDLPLREGRNELLLKVTNFGGAFGFYFQVKSENANVLTPDVEKGLLTSSDQRSEDQIGSIREHYRRNHSAEWRAVDAERATAQGGLTELQGQVPTTMVMAERKELRPAHRLDRGQYDQPLEMVMRATPGALPSLSADAPRDRLGLALWLIDPGHPLTSRVYINRLWQRLFGTGLVKTAEDFGSRGEWPTHPELLDWLAVHFVEGGWDVKATFRLLVTSATYRQNAAVTPELLAHDPENRLFARGPRFRLAAEEIRDSALFASGLLVERMGGPPVKPYQPEGLWRAVAYPDSTTANFKRDSGEALYRRSLYTFWKRTSPPPSMTLLDAPSREACTVLRARTNTPLQALVLLNDVQFVEAARAFAVRALREGGGNDDERLVWAFRTATSRSPTSAEVSVLRDILAKARLAFAGNAEAAAELTSIGESSPHEDFDVSELATWTVLGNTVLNLDAFVTKG